MKSIKVYSPVLSMWKVLTKTQHIKKVIHHDQLVIQRMQDCFNIRKSINIIPDVNRSMEKNTIISIDARTDNRNQHPFLTLETQENE